MKRKVINSEDLTSNLLLLRANPAKIQQYMLNLLEQLTDGAVIPVDATNPAIFCLESAAVLSSATIIDNESKLRRQYPVMANTPEELYHHMADIDYLNIFSSPATARIVFNFDLDEVLQKAVYDNNISGTRKITIPRYTRVTVSGIDLHLLYPIDIRIMTHGGLNITFDVSEVHPLGRVENNVLDWHIDVQDNVRFLRITVPMHQVSIERNMMNLNAASGFTREYVLNDRFCYARAYIQNEKGEWLEIRTTHSDLVYNKDKPTVILKLLNNALKVIVPQIYFNSGKVTDAIRLDIYTTKGEMDLNLTNYMANAYTSDWLPLQNTPVSIFTAPLQTFNTYGFYSQGAITGGSNGISFEQLKENVTSRNAVYEGLPISEKQLIHGVGTMGYRLVKNIDNITDRQYLATKYLPGPKNGFVVGNLGITVGMLETSILKLRELDTVTSSSYRFTIKPGTLFKMDKGILKLVPSETTNQYKTKAINDPHYLSTELNKHTLLYTPYYYVFDVKNDEIVNRIYDMDSPKILSRYFFQDNPSTAISLGVDRYVLTNAKTKDGYILQVRLNVGEVVKTLGPAHVNIQLSYLDREGRNRYFIEGKLETPIDNRTGKPYNDEYIYSFKIETRYDIDSQDGLIPIPYRAPINLVHEFDIVTIINDYLGDGNIQKSDIDTIINHQSLPNFSTNKIYHGVSQHKVVIEFGKRMKHIWYKTRTVVDDGQIEKWESDVPARYEEDQYELDATGNVKVLYDVENNNVTTKVIRRKGELIRTPTGEQVWKHRKGDPKLDDAGKPIYKFGGDGLIRQIDFVLLDAKYYFANTKEVVDYRDTCNTLLTQWCTQDMQLIYHQLLDRSEIFFYPSTTIGNVRVIADNNKEVTIDSKQSLRVTCFLSEIDMRNASLRESLVRTITDVIQRSLNRKTISVDALHQNLRAIIGNTVKSFIVDGLFDNKYKAVTLDDDTMGLTIGTLTTILPNMQIGLKDDIEVNFLAHDIE